MVKDETRTLFTLSDLTVMAWSEIDNDSSPNDQDHDSDEARADFLRRFCNDEWQYYGMSVSVQWRGSEIGSASVWGVYHGAVAEVVECDAWELTPARYEEPNVVTMASALSGVVVEALGDAAEFLDSIGSPPASVAVREALGSARRQFDPNNPAHRTSSAPAAEAPEGTTHADSR